jgi:hypothetical protein
MNESVAVQLLQLLLFLQTADELNMSLVNRRWVMEKDTDLHRQ